MITPPIPHRTVSQIGMLSFVSGSDEFSEQADDDARDDDSDDLHASVPLLSAQSRRGDLPAATTRCPTHKPTW
jgi:hypothetical protein